MKTGWHKAFAIIALIIMACHPNPESMKENLEGYWEISEVYQGGDLLKSYSYSSNIDYFELINDSVGFRKKVSPTLNGKYNVTNHETPFILRTENGRLKIYYSDREVNYSETVIQADGQTLKIENERGLIYAYTPYEPINLDE